MSLSGLGNKSIVFIELIGNFENRMFNKNNNLACKSDRLL
jgi:hypothetical protein